MKRKWWLIMAAIVLIAVLSLCFFGVRLRIAPKLILSRALNDGFTQLEARFEKSPIHLLEEVYEDEGQYRADLQLETELPHLGLVRYDMEVRTQAAPLRTMVFGTVVTGGKAVDISLYLDSNFAAVSSDNLVEGNYYGITYDTFSADVRGRELLAALIGNETIKQWEDDVSKLSQTMSVELKMPELSPGDIRTALYAVLVLDPQVSRQTFSRFGEQITVHTVSFRATGQQIAEAAEPYQKDLTPQLAAWIDTIKDDPAFYVEAVFFLDQGTLIKLEGNYGSSQGSGSICADLGDGKEPQAIALELEMKAGEDLNRISLSVDNTADADCYKENTSLIWTKNGIQQSFALDYSFDLSSGEMDLSCMRDGKAAQIRMHLAGEAERITITTQNAAPLLELFREDPLESPVICTLSLMPGDEIVTPEYRNLDQWSMEDLWTLLKGLGALLGIQFS